ncbi:MAG: tetratricopeptide repeat protein, partial [Bryobacterales bacterium]|nr:tetratricopeptide repeat protein [Bryobacterales bacterium]
MTPSLPRTELSRIIRFLQANQGQFAFAFVRVNSWELRDRVIEELAGAVRPDLRVHVVDYADEDPPSLLADLQRRGDSVDPRGVLCLIGLERHFLGSSGFVRSMNHDRDGFPEAVLCPMLLWLSDAAADKLYADAPDFADWHSFAFRLDEEEDVAGVELGPSLPVVESERSPFSESFLRERVQLLRTALGRDEREHGADHPAVALRLEQLAAALERLQQYPEALSAIVRALEIRAKAVGQPGGREQLAGVLLLKGNIERRLRMLAAAEASYDQALEIYDELVRGGRSDLREHV